MSLVSRPPAVAEPETAVPPSGLVALRSPAGSALIAATVLASMVGFLDAYVVNVAVPAISHGLSASVTAVQWMLTGYLVTVAALLLLSGALADRFGRRRVLSVGLLVMLVASILCAVAPSANALIAARVIQGVGAAMVVPSSLALLNGTLRVADRARGIGVWAGLSTIGTTVGPYAGGWLVDHVSWRAVFLLNLPLIAAALPVLRRVPETGGEPRPLSLDLFGALAGIAGLGAIIYALTAGPSSGWLHAPVLAAAVIGVLALAALVPIERRQRAPMLRLALFASRQFDAINAATLLFYGALGAASYLVVLECQLQLGYSASQAGAALIPESVVFLLIAPVSGVLVAKVGPRWLMVAGHPRGRRRPGVALAGHARRGIRRGAPARSRAVGAGDRHRGHPADSVRPGRGQRRRSRRGLGDQRRGLAGRRRGHRRSRPGAHRGQCLVRTRAGPRRRVRAGDDRHRRVVRRRRARDRRLRLQPPGRRVAGDAGGPSPNPELRACRHRTGRLGLSEHLSRPMEKRP